MAFTDVTLSEQSFTSISLDEGGEGQGFDTSRFDSLPFDYSNTIMRPPYVTLTEES